MTCYLLYARAGKEFQVADDLRLLGIDAWCGRCIEWKRVGKRRRPDPYELPILPNYIFAEMSPYDFYRAQTVKHLNPTMMVIPQSSMRGLRTFQKATDEAYREQSALRDKMDAPAPEFDPQQLLRMVPWDIIVRFREVVNADDPLNRKIEVDGPLGRMQLDPLDVRVAE